MGHAKMAGSVGNVVNVGELLKQHQPETVRFLLLNTHYRSPIEWTEERLREIGRALQGFSRFFERYERVSGRTFFTLPVPLHRDQMTADITQKIAIVTHQPDLEFLQELTRLRERFFDCMDDDFNTGGAIG